MHAANWNPEVILTIGRSISVPAIAFNAFLFMLPVATGTLAPGLLYVYAVGNSSGFSRLVYFGTLVLAVLGIVVMPAVYFACALGGLWIIRQLKKAVINSIDLVDFSVLVSILRDRFSAYVSFALGVSVVATVFSTQMMWLPVEVLSMNSGRSITGYVLKSGDHSVVVLHEKSRTTEILPAENVKRRKFCSIARDKISHYKRLTEKTSKNTNKYNYILYYYYEYKVLSYRVNLRVNREPLVDIFTKKRPAETFARCSQIVD